MIDQYIELILGSGMGAFGMYLMYMVLNNLIINIETKMVQQVDALILVSQRQDEIFRRLSALEEGLGH